MAGPADKHTTREKEIVSLLEQRDKEGLRLLYDHYSAALYGIISRVIRQEAVAQEVLQDAFLKIWDNIDKYDSSRGKLFTWMAQLTRNLAIDTVRSRQFRKERKTVALPDRVSNEEKNSEEQPPTDPGLRKLVEQMDDKSRRIIDLLYFHDYTQRETSEALGIPLGTVKSRARKAISDLRKILGKEGLLSLVMMFKTIMEGYFGH